MNVAVFLDLKKAFDTVDHDILLSKLMKYGVHGTSYDWFRSYLDCRKQRCFIHGSLSGDHFLACGIPQGTILGPLLFIIYVYQRLTFAPAEPLNFLVSGEAFDIDDSSDQNTLVFRLFDVSSRVSADQSSLRWLKTVFRT